MTPYEVLSIISISLSSLIAVSSTVIPLVINHYNNRLQKAEIQRENNRQYRENVYNEKLKIVDDFITAYALWLVDKSNKNNLILTLYKLSARFYGITSKSLINFADMLLKDSESNNDYENIYQECLRNIFNYLGITHSAFLKEQQLTTVVLRNKF